MSSGWNRLWLSRISHIWEKRPGWLQRGTLRGLPFKRFARKPPKGNSASRPRRLPRIPKAWHGLPGSDNQALLEKIGESRFEERNRGRGRCLNPANQNCGIYLQIYLHSAIYSKFWISMKYYVNLNSTKIWSIISLFEYRGLKLWICILIWIRICCSGGCKQWCNP